MTQNDVMQLLIGKDVGASSPSKTTGQAVNLYTDLLDGEIITVNAHNVAVDATTVLTDDLVKHHGIKFIQRNGTNLIHSDLIKQENIVSAKGKVDAAGVEQVSYIGYNGTSGSVTATNSKLYVIRVALSETDVTGFGQEMIINAPYKSDASATQPEVANGLALSLHRQFARQTVQPIKVELISNVADVATAALANTATVVLGSDSVTCLTNTDYNTDVDLAVGDFIRVNATLTTTGGAVTDAVYKVIELTSATVFKVDRPISQASGSYKGGVTVLSAAKVLAGDMGIKLTGIARTFAVGKYRYSKVAFTIGLDSAASFGDTAVSYTTAMSLGSGTYEQIAELEWDLLGNAGDEYRNDFLWSAYKANATSGETYDVMALTYYGDHSTGGVGATPRRMKQLVFAFETGFSTTEGPDIVHDVLEAYTTVDMVVGV